MNPSIDSNTTACSDFVIVSDPSGLRAIRQRNVHFALLRRALHTPLSRTLALWTERAVLAIDTVLPRDQPLTKLDGLSTLAAYAWLHADIAHLLATFREVSDAHDVRMTLGVRRSDACRKFHTDFVRMRLITTYVGPGTEWVPSAAVRREVLAAPPSCPVEANRQIVRDLRAIRRARTGDVLLLKGERYEGANGAVHRSPPIEARGLSRLVLTLSTCD